MNRILSSTVMMVGLIACKKNDTSPLTPAQPAAFSVKGIQINNVSWDNSLYGVNSLPEIKIRFSGPVREGSVTTAVTVTTDNALPVPITVTYQSNDSVVLLNPALPLKFLTRYLLKLDTSLKSSAGGSLIPATVKYFFTQIDSTDKFQRISDNALLTLVQQQTFKYFWEFGHPVSGLARERSSSADIVTTGGSGFGIMSMLVGVQRNFITRAAALSRIDTMVNFLTSKVTRYHGAFPHWINGLTGATVPFSSWDDGGDIVETSYLMQGLLCARQFFNNPSDVNEINLHGKIDGLYNAVEWNWYRNNNQNVLYWNWSPDFNWAVGVQVGGWNEALITYVLAASSNIDSNAIPKIVYDNGWAHNGSIKNGNSYYGVQLPLGVPFGGPLFFSQYSFLGINPNGLSDAYANYWVQNTAHTTINYLYCADNPRGYFGYSKFCWGLTASDIPNGYSASSPASDDGVIAPTAALSSFPYSPGQSMDALHFFYYQLGDKIWGAYGFTDAFDLTNLWYDRDCLAIDQGPEIIMIENYRTALLWNLFMSCPEVKRGMKNLGFQSPNL
ncbi:MAG: glucoamylase family protein [Chitinophagales bacterium]